MRNLFFCSIACALVWAALAPGALAAAQQGGNGPGAQAGGGAQAEPAVPAEPQNPLTIPEGYRYDPAGRRDPFVNPSTPPRPAEIVRIPDVRPPGLPGVLLNETELTAIVRSQDPQASVVVIEAPGSRVFVAHAGDQLYDVVIREIRSADVIFEVKPLEGDDPLAPRALVARALTQENE